jgi:hypothetical protein
MGGPARSIVTSAAVGTAVDVGTPVAATASVEVADGSLATGKTVAGGVTFRLQADKINAIIINVEII